MRITYITTISIISLPGYYKYVKINVILQVKYKREIYIFISTDNINTSYTIIDTIFAMASRQHNMLTQAAGGRALDAHAARGRGAADALWSARRKAPYAGRSGQGI